MGAVRQREKACLLAIEKFLDDDFLAGLAKGARKHGIDCRIGCFALMSDDDALALCQTISLLTTTGKPNVAAQCALAAGASAQRADRRRRGYHVRRKGPSRTPWTPPGVPPLPMGRALLSRSPPIGPQGPRSAVLRARSPRNQFPSLWRNGRSHPNPSRRSRRTLPLALSRHCPAHNKGGKAADWPKAPKRARVRGRPIRREECSRPFSPLARPGMGCIIAA